MLNEKEPILYEDEPFLYEEGTVQFQWMEDPRRQAKLHRRCNPHASTLARTLTPPLRSDGPDDALRAAYWWFLRRFEQVRLAVDELVRNEPEEVGHVDSDTAWESLSDKAIVRCLRERAPAALARVPDAALIGLVAGIRPYLMPFRLYR